MPPWPPMYYIGLGLDTELLGFLVAQFLPGFGTGRIDAVPGAERPGEARLFLVTFQLDHRRQKALTRPFWSRIRLVAERNLGLERDPALGYAVGFGRAFSLGDFPVARLCASKAGAEHFANLIATFQGVSCSR